MFERDGIVYAGNETIEKEVIYAEYLGNHSLRIAFNTGEIVDVDFSQNFDGDAFLPLKDVNILKDFDYSLGFLTWLNGSIDVAPEYLLSIGKMIEGSIVA